MEKNPRPLKGKRINISCKREHIGREKLAKKLKCHQNICICRKRGNTESDSPNEVPKFDCCGDEGFLKLMAKIAVSTCLM